MKKAIGFLTLASLLFCGQSYADVGSGQQAASGKKTAKMTFEQLKESCRNPAAFQSQLPPNNIRITCQDARVVWVPQQQRQFQLQEQRFLQTALASDKYHVIQESSPVPMQQNLGSCPEYQEVNQGVKIDKKLTCDEILAHEGSLYELCLGTVNKALEENIEIMTEKATGRIFTACDTKIIKADERR